MVSHHGLRQMVLPSMPLRHEMMEAAQDFIYSRTNSVVWISFTTNLLLMQSDDTTLTIKCFPVNSLFASCMDTCGLGLSTATVVDFI